jgi:hypothetical protein
MRWFHWAFLSGAVCPSARVVECAQSVGPMQHTGTSRVGLQMVSEQPLDLAPCCEPGLLFARLRCSPRALLGGLAAKLIVVEDGATLL